MFEVRLRKDENNEWVRVVKSGFRTKKEAEAACAELLSAEQRGDYYENNDLSLAEFMELWLTQYAKARMRPTTFASRKQILESRILPQIGHLKLDKMTPLMVTKFMNRLLADNLSPSYVVTITNILRSAFKQAVKWQMLKTNIMDSVDSPKIEQTEIQTLSLDEGRQLLDYTRTQEQFAHIAIVLAFYCGMRRGETLGLRWSDVDFDRGQLSVVQTLSRIQKGGLVFQEPKTKSGRRLIDVPSIAMDELRKHRMFQLKYKMQYGEAFHDQDLVCSNSNGSPFDPRNLIRCYDRAIQRSGVKKIRFHDLRHTHATIMLQLGEHPKVVSERLGHSRVQITLDTYSHVTPTMQKEAADRFNEAMKNVQSKAK
jgi:integrase